MIIKSGNVQNYCFARNVKGADIEKLAQAIKSTEYSEYIKKFEMKLNFEKFKAMYLLIKQLVTDEKMDLAQQMLNSLDSDELSYNDNDKKGTAYTKVSKKNK